jgi:AraC family transcriptional regulator, transcriptional activator FtrA
MRPRRPDPRHVATLAYDGLGTFELGIVVEVFGLPRPEVGPDWYRFRVCALERRRLRATGGVTVQATGSVTVLARAGTIVIPGWRVHDTPPPRLVAALRRAHDRGARLVSICSGVFVLAATGLLDGRRATTHWRYVEALRSRYPRIRVEPDVLYVDEGSILTSAGSAAGIDLCLHIVRRDFGAAIANQVARRLVVPPVRDGGQAQFAVQPMPREEAPALARVLDWANAHLDRTLGVDALAARAGMSPRNFARRFKEATGTTPHRWLVHQRVLAAQRLLEQTGRSIDRIAESVGLQTAATLREHFRRTLKTTPTAYRRAFSVRARPVPLAASARPSGSSPRR